jgi:predicted transcriptional regulator
MSKTIRVSEATRDRYSRLAEATVPPMTQLLDEAADALERRLFFDRFTAGYDELRADPVRWAELEGERRIESGATADRAR